MKYSGIKWIGNIPDTWRLARVKNLFYISKAKARQENPVILKLARAGVQVRDISNNEGQLAESYYEYNPVKFGDLLLNPMDLYSGANCNMAEVEGVISPAYSNLRRIDNNCDPKFYDYYFKTQYWAMAMFAHGKGISYDNRWTLNNDALLNYYIPYPSYEEQVSIVNKIKEKSLQIEHLIEIENESIERLKEYKIAFITEVIMNGLNPNATLKDIGNKWNLKMPDHWNYLKMSKICSVITDYVASGSFASLRENVIYRDEPDYAMLVRTTDLSQSARSETPVYVDKKSYDFLHNSNLFGGEIVLPNIGASCGDVYIVPQLYKNMTLAPNSIMIKTKYDDKFYYYFFMSNLGRNMLLDLCASTAQQKFNKTELRNLRVVCPPIQEQKQIVEYLDKKCNDIDTLIGIKKTKIDELIEYKKSMIFELVTGKIN